ncbi:hypothetical protein BCR44DRAFT_82987 [Catenaria anguillulae PL171]|uniref:Uncharacterized protein n=1 Tax=Catenaria anguillulae PL171 TaxID=765915 RepID=A0A1Y2HV28_9FUNG|nr:hypothetical protein BCR44DRAFT_82987 [Catenaria anguillulae PL171]
MKMMLRLLSLLVAVLSVTIAVAAQDNQQPTFINPATKLPVNANETACLAKLNWPKCYAWNWTNAMYKDDPGLKKYEAQVCTQECMSMKASLSRKYVESMCGANPILPREIKMDKLDLYRIQAQFTCSKDEFGGLCSALQMEAWEAAKFNASDHLGPDEVGQLPWSVVPKEYACSKCVLQDIEVEKQMGAWYNLTESESESVGLYNRTEAAMQERAQLCKGWKPSRKTGSSSPANGRAIPPGSSSASSFVWGSTMAVLVGVVVAIAAL